MQNRRPNQLIDIVDAQRFIEALTGNSKSSLVFQTIDDVETVDAGGAVTRRNRPDLRHVLIGPLSQHLATLTRLNNQGAGIFVQVNEGARGSRNITGVRALFADDDGVGIEPPLEPAIIVQTSADPKNRHFYWPLHPGESLERFKPLQRRIAEVLGTDKSVNNLDRVLRLPGSFHNKSKPFRVKLLKADSSLKYTMDEVEVAIEQAATENEYIPLNESITPAPGNVGPGRQPLKRIRSAAPPKAPDTGKETAATARRLRSWLTARGVRFGEKAPENGAIRFVLDRCPLNKTHREAQIVALPTGAIHAGCFHNECGGNGQKWNEFRNLIGGYHGDGGFDKGDHVELVDRLVARLKREPIDVIKGAGDDLLRYDPSLGRWCKIDDVEQINVLWGFSGFCVGEKGTLKLKRTDIASVIRLAREKHHDSTFHTNVAIGLAFKNGFLEFDTGGKMKLVPHSADHHATTGHDFDYDPAATAPRFLQYLEECFEGDADSRPKIELIQEFAGACLIGVATKFQQALVLIGAGANGKALDITTKIPTPEGWQKLGDLKVGDQIFDELGRPCAVVALSEIWTDRPCYRIRFSDNSTIVADANHEWPVRICDRPETIIKTTHQIAAQLTRDARVKTSILPFSNSRKSLFIFSCTPVDSVPVRCIQVDSPSHQYLCGESMIPTHNSVLVEILLALVKNHAAVPPHEFAQQYMRARLLGAKLNAAAEIPEGAILDASAFKAIIAGDAVEARLPYGKPFTFTPVAGHVFSANTLPPINDFAAGFWRRLLLIEWNRKFAPEEQNRWLAPTIIQQEMPGICSWALAGAQQLLGRGRYTMPESATARITTWKREVNPVALWAHECTRPVAPEEPKRYTASAEAYRAFVDWAEANGHKRLSHVAFSRRLNELNIVHRRTEEGRDYALEITQVAHPYIIQ